MRPDNIMIVEPVKKYNVAFGSIKVGATFAMAVLARPSNVV